MLNLPSRYVSKNYTMPVLWSVERLKFLSKENPTMQCFSVGGSSHWCAFNNAALCKRTASCICPRSLNVACFSGPLNPNSELQIVNMVTVVFVTHWILNQDLGKTLCQDLQRFRKMGITQERQVVHPSSANLFFHLSVITSPWNYIGAKLFGMYKYIRKYAALFLEKGERLTIDLSVGWINQATHPNLGGDLVRLLVKLPSLGMGA